MADPEKERLDELGREIDQARSQAQEHDTIPDPEREDGFYEVGDERSPQDDGHELTPPG